MMRMMKLTTTNKINHNKHTHTPTHTHTHTHIQHTFIVIVHSHAIIHRREILIQKLLQGCDDRANGSDGGEPTLRFGGVAAQRRRVRVGLCCEWGGGKGNDWGEGGAFYIDLVSKLLVCDVCVCMCLFVCFIIIIFFFTCFE